MELFKRHMAPLWYAAYASPLGTLFLALSEKGVTDLLINPSGGEGAFLKAMEEKYKTPPKSGNARFSPAFRALDGYFSKRPYSFSLPLSPLGTPFELAVWKALTAIPWGETRSYGYVASAVRKQSAARAVGNACGANPVPIVIPCHRVLKGDGTLGGYSGGLDIKETLLKIEGRRL